MIVEVQALLLEAPFPMDQTAASKNIRIDLRCLSEGVNHHGHDPKVVPTSFLTLVNMFGEFYG